MPKVSIAEAARLTGKTRRTIDRHLKDGNISSETDSDGVRRIDVSELIRYYRILPGRPSEENVSLGLHESETELERIRRELAVEKSKTEQLQERLKDKDRHIESIEKAMLFLESSIGRSETLNRPWWKFW
jgi:septal ring factor EnvC (AmiA/AmiB activator)